MSTSLFVISDLQLGGAPAAANAPSFEMTPPRNRETLAAFFAWLAALAAKGPQRIHLVLAGDVVDFLAEAPCEPFTANDDAARAKLAAVIERTRPVWNALRAAVAAGVQLTILPGTHDLELSLAGPRRLLLDTLGPGRVEHIYDNQALIVGPVLIEHGNRPNPWAAVNHDTLREIRSAGSRREPLEFAFGPPPASDLYHRAVVPLKQKFGFVDLLQPAGSALIPLLTVLDPRVYAYAPILLTSFVRSKMVSYHPDGRPKDRGMIGASTADPGGVQSDPDVVKARADLELARKFAGAPEAGQIGAMDKLVAARDFVQSLVSPDRDVSINRLNEALRVFSEQGARSWDVAREEPKYLTPAKAAAGRGFRVVVMGHTHCPKRVPLAAGAGAQPAPLAAGGALYLNCGSWSDLMRLPDFVLEGNPEANDELKRFVANLGHGRLDDWRFQVPTFARVDLDDSERIAAADVYLFNGKDGGAPLPDGNLRRPD